MGIVQPVAGSISSPIDRRAARTDRPLARRRSSTSASPSFRKDGGCFPSSRSTENLLLGRLPAQGTSHPAQSRRSAIETFPSPRRSVHVPARRQHERRRAADARPGARTDVGSRSILLIDEPSVGLAPLLVKPHHRQDQGAEGRVSPHGADGRAELQPGHPHCRPRLRHRPRPHRIRRRNSAEALNDNELIREFYLGA
jgi:branched-chain amino acid transport system ATP-binding protein